MEFNFIINNYDKSFLNNADLRIYFSDFWLIYFLLQVLLINWQIILLYPLDTILYRRYKNLDRELQFWQTLASNLTNLTNKIHPVYTI